MLASQIKSGVRALQALVEMETGIKRVRNLTLLYDLKRTYSMNSYSFFKMYLKKIMKMKPFSKENLTFYLSANLRKSL